MATTKVAAVASKQKVYDLPVESCTISALNARVTEPEQEYIEALAMDIGANGQLQPGLVRSTGKGKYEVVFGGCRLRAVTLLNELRAKNEEPIPFKAFVVDATDEVALARSVAENFREDLNVVDEATAMSRLMESGKTRAEVAGMFHVSPAQVTQRLKVLKLSAKVRRAAARGEIPTEAALVLAGIEDKAEQEKTFEEAIQWQQWLDETAEATAKEMEETEAAAAAEAESTTTEGEAETPANGKGKKATTKKTTTKKAKTTGKKAQTVSTAAVKKAAKSRGHIEEEEGKPRTRKQFEDLLDSLNTTAASKPARELMRALIGWFNGDMTDQRLANAFDRYCKE